MKRKLTKEEKAFCRCFSALRNVREAAALSGFEGGAQAAAQALGERKELRSMVEGFDALAGDLSKEAVAGLRRLAFGSVADGVRLLLCEGETDPAEIEKMDLFNVAEIKKPRGGGLEIKFFDRLKPLERLLEAGASSGDKGASAFYEALNAGAKALVGRK